MLNKIKKNIIPMLDTLGDALTQYLAQPADELLDGITQFINAINVPIEDESKAAIALSDQLKASLKNPVLSEVERLYNEYCTTIENLPIQYKAVFLPYYDNTWDSLASVYTAFAADPMFVTEIVIIPIRRNTLTGWKMVYEDYLTPMGIPNTHFLQYSFESDLPDFVFYNNPYDGVNIEKFQMHNIKPYAGCMVYIPYALYRRMFHDKEGMVYAIEVNTLLSGHDFSDVFIAQGKSFFKTYAHLSRNGSKMAALGNPKTDNIYNHIKSYPRYPEWDKATKDKTVFFLNTHYTFPINDESYKGFFTDLVEFIEQNEDLALIWRPHPQSFLMFEEDDQSERYLRWKGYLEHVKNHERMILDRTSSDISAIMYCDAVLSHNSSVVSESIVADKPLFLLGYEWQEMIEPEELPNLSVEAYNAKLKRVRKYDVKNLFLYSAVCYVGLEEMTEKKEPMEEWWKPSMIKFMNDIRNGIDTKKELRKHFREQSFANLDGTCGQKIHDYIVGRINNGQWPER